MTLTEFLLARITEDEASFELPEWRPDVGGDWTLSGDGFFANYWPDNTVSAAIYQGEREVADSGIVAKRSRAECQVFAEQWIREHSRALRECEAKRRIVDYREQCERDRDEAPDVARDLFGVRLLAFDTTLRALALPYADHPDYDEAWRP